MRNDQVLSKGDPLDEVMSIGHVGLEAEFLRSGVEREEGSTGFIWKELCLGVEKLKVTVIVCYYN